MGQCWPSWAVGPREGHAIHQVFVVLFICAQRLYPIVPPNRYNRYFFLGAKQNPNKQVCLAKVIYSCIHSTSPPCSWYAIHAIERTIFMQSLPLDSQGFQGSGQHDGMNVTSTISKGFSQNLKCVKHHKAKKLTGTRHTLAMLVVGRWCARLSWKVPCRWPCDWNQAWCPEAWKRQTSSSDQCNTVTLSLSLSPSIIFIFTYIESAYIYIHM